MGWVVELTGYDVGAGVERTLRYAMGEGIAFADAPYAPSALLKWASPSQKIDVGREGRVEMAFDAGELVLGNTADDVGQAGPLDDLADYVWNGRRAALYRVDGTVWADAQLAAWGVLEQPVAPLAAGGRYDSRLVFPLRDPRAELETALQTTKFAGTNADGAGVEGEADLKGRPKPIVYGLVSNVSPPRVNAAKLIHQVADRSVEVITVRDGGVPLGAGSTRASLAALQSTDPSPGTWDVYAGAEGTFIRLGSTPVYPLTCDAQEGGSLAARTAAQIWKRIRTERCGTDAAEIDAASVTTADVDDDGECGWFWDQETTRKDALDEVLGGFSGYELLGWDAKWRIAKLKIPSGTPDLDFALLTPTARKTATTRWISELTRVRPSYAPQGMPPYRVNVRWGRNYTVMAPSDFAAYAAQRLKDKFAEEWRTASETDAGVWDPEAQTGPWRDAPELTVQTGYQPGPDYLISPAAEAEAARLAELYTTLRPGFTVSWTPAPTDRPQPGDVASLTFPAHGLAAGKAFRVLQAGLVVEAGHEPVASAVLGLGT